MKIKAYYKESDNQGFWNEKELELNQVPEQNLFIKIDGVHYQVDLTEMEENQKKPEYSIYLRKIATGEKLHAMDHWHTYMYIVVCCSVQKYDAKKVINTFEKALSTISQDKPFKIINGYLPLDVVREKKFDPTWVEYLNNKFAHDQISFYDKVNNKVRREEMAEFAARANAVVITIGAIEDGVKEEFDLLQKKGLTIHSIHL